MSVAGAVVAAGRPGGPYGDILGIWRTWATDVRGHGIASGHHMAEEAPEELAAALGDFFSPA